MRAGTVLKIAELVTLIFTLGVVGFYTKETYRLRKTAEQQLAQSRLPLVVLDFRRKQPERNEHLCPIIRNVGFGTAFNVQIGDLSHGHYMAHFRLLPALFSNSKHEMRPLMTRNGKPSTNIQISYLRELFKSAANQPISDLSEPLPRPRLPVSVICMDGLGHRTSLNKKSSMIRLRTKRWHPSESGHRCPESQC